MRESPSKNSSELFTLEISQQFEDFVRRSESFLRMDSLVKKITIKSNNYNKYFSFHFLSVGHFRRYLLWLLMLHCFRPVVVIVAVASTAVLKDEDKETNFNFFLSLLNFVRLCGHSSITSHFWKEGDSRTTGYTLRLH